jgi:hypothetical protein
MNSGTKEKRRFKRTPFDSKVIITGTNSEWQSKLIDISLKGVLIDMPENWQGKEQDAFKLDISLGNDEVIIHMDASVSHVGNQHIGFHCSHIDINSIVHLKRLMELNLGDAKLVNRELHLLGQ